MKFFVVVIALCASWNVVTAAEVEVPNVAVDAVVAADPVATLLVENVASLAIEEQPTAVVEPIAQDVVVTVIADEVETRELYCTALAGKQCGGHNFRGCTGCPSGYSCKYSNYWWSDCKRSTSSTTCKNIAKSQCGGKNFYGSKCCPSGYICKYSNTYWSDCQRGATALSVSPSSPSAPSSPSYSSSGLPSRSYSVSTPNPYKTAVHGDSTYYGIQLWGNCGFDKGSDPWRPSWQQHYAKVDNNDPDKFWPAAVDSTMFDDSKACGMCFVATLDDYQPYGGGHYYGWYDGVRFGVVVDQCPDAGCHYGHVDWRGVGGGRFKQTWIAIECPVERERTNFLYYKVPASSSYYLKFQIRNARQPISSGRIRFAGRDWTNLSFPPDRDNFFTIHCGGGAYCDDTFDLEVTSQFGATVTDYGIRFSGDMAYGDVQFSSKQK